MDINSARYFTTGEFAKLCSVNKRTLFHYDDIGLFKPAFTDENGYRYYSYHQFEVFTIISILKELDVPLIEVKKYLDERTPEQLISLSRQKLQEADEKINRLNRIKHLLEETIAFTKEGLSAEYGEITLEEQEEEYLIRSELLSEENTKDYLRWMLEFSNFETKNMSKDTSFVGTMLSKENILSRDYYNNSYFFVKTLNRSRSNEVKPKGLYAVIYHHGNYDTIGLAYDKLIDYCDKNGLRLGEFSYEESLLDIVSVQNEDDYVMKLTLAVERI